VRVELSCLVLIEATLGVPTLRALVFAIDEKPQSRRSTAPRLSIRVRTVRVLYQLAAPANDTTVFRVRWCRR
jgi:hypothetical protein